MRDARGRFDFNLGPEELAHYNKLNLKTELERILTAPFDSGGRPKGVTTEQFRWAAQVCRERPAWSVEVLDKLEVQSRTGAKNGSL